MIYLFIFQKLKTKIVFFKKRYLNELIKIQENDLELKKIEEDVKTQNNLLKELGFNVELDDDLSQIFVTNPAFSGIMKNNYQQGLIKEKLDTFKSNLNLQNKSEVFDYSRIFPHKSEDFKDVFDELENVKNIDEFQTKYDLFRKINYTTISDDSKYNFSAKIDDLIFENIPKDPFLKELYIERQLYSLLKQKNNELLQINKDNNFEANNFYKKWKIELKTETIDDKKINSDLISKNFSYFLNNVEKLAEQELAELNELEADQIYPEISPQKTFKELIDEMSQNSKVTQFLENNKKNKKAVKNIKNEVGFIKRFIIGNCRSC